MEIKKAASPGKNAVKNFHVLDPVRMANTADAANMADNAKTADSAKTFGGLDALKAEIGNGSVVCLAADLLPIDEKNWYVPVWLI